MAKKSDKSDTPSIEIRDSLAETLMESLNKESKGGKVAFFLDTGDDPSQIVDWISTGNSMVDLDISNRPYGGIPVGRITELTGLEASGKSLMGAHILAETQRKGGVAVFIDTESSVDANFLTAIGVDVKKLLYISVSTVEEIFENIESIVEKIRKSNKDRLVTILIDSVAAASTAKEAAADHGQDGYATGKAIIISKAMRKITEMIARQRICLVFTNQLRQKLGFVGFGDPWTTSGGKALAFHASVRLRLKGTGQIKAGDTIVGIKTKATVIKNRMGPPMRSTEFNIFFDRGIDNYGNWLDLALDYDVIAPAKVETTSDDGKKKTKKELEEERAAMKKAKSLQFLYNSDKSDPSVVEKVVFERKDFSKLLLERPEVKEAIYLKLCDARIMKYNTDGSSEEIEISDGGEGMEE